MMIIQSLEREPRPVIHSLRTAVAALLSLLLARLTRLPEDYWAAITTMIVMQSTWGAALKISVTRLAGTAIGATAGALLATWFGPNPYIFAAAIFLLGLFCALLRLGRTAYRYAGITVAIILLVPHQTGAWSLAAHRFIEVSLGIVVGLAMTVAWPERLASVRPAPPQKLSPREQPAGE